jgi:excinuclease ABC subunit A
VTGVSGSGKSSLAFDTIYAEGQRRFVDCLATYARQFLERLERPDADFIGHLEPPLALKQSVAVRSARSTVGTMSEVADYLQLLFAHAGEPHCAVCGTLLVHETVETAVARILEHRDAERICIVAPIARDRLGSEGIGGLLKQGYTRTLRDGIVGDWPAVWLEAKPAALPDEVPVVVDRFTRSGMRRTRLAESVGIAWHLGQGRATLYGIPADGTAAQRLDEFKEGAICRSCGAKGEPPSPSLFSANSPLGACPSCQGFGRLVTIDPDKVVPDPRRTLRNDAVLPFRMPSRRGWHRRMMRVAAETGIRTETPWSDLTDEERKWVFSGNKKFPGVTGFFRKLERKRYRMHIRIFLSRFRGYVPCPDCRATRLRPAALAVTIEGKNLADLNDMPIGALRSFMDGLRLPPEREKRVKTVLRELRARLQCLDEVGLGYLTLSRTSRTLSGGETQRLRLAAGMGASLTRTLYVLDEPTVGLHARDAARVLGVLRRICRSGNTVLVVEHDPAVTEGADHLIVLGPEGGDRGGELLYEGPPAAFLKEQPGFFRVASGRMEAPPVDRVSDAPPSAPARRPSLRLQGLRANNLRIDDLSIPLQGIVAVSGVSGSGKSTLVDEVIYRNWRRFQGQPVEDVGPARSITGFEALDEIILIGQEPLGRSTRSNAVSFVKVLPILRTLLAKTPDAEARRLKPRDFSFNVPGGRCEICRGLGTVILEMHFLPDVEVTCEACKGRRFREEVLEVSYRGRNIQAFLEMTADEAGHALRDTPDVVRRLRPLQDVGLGYIRLGQPTSTLSGGEAQRLKLASFLAEGGSQGKRLFLFDEPTTGLHARDVGRLLAALRALNHRGDCVLVVEHHLDFLAASDWIIDLGPGAGDEGGRIVCAGPVEEVLRCKESITGRTLAAHLGVARARRSEGRSYKDSAAPSIMPRNPGPAGAPSLSGEDVATKRRGPRRRRGGKAEP